MQAKAENSKTKKNMGILMSEKGYWCESQVYRFYFL
jgi:hypothetical protein